MNNEKVIKEGADLSEKVDDLSRASKGPFRSHIWRYRWLYFLMLYLPVIIPVFYMEITAEDDFVFSGSFFSASLSFFVIIPMMFLWMFSMFYLTIGKLTVGKKWRWLVAIFLCPPLVLIYFLKDRD